MPAKRDDRTAPPKAENDARQGIVVARRATGAIVPALPAGHNRTLRRRQKNAFPPIETGTKDDASAVPPAFAGAPAHSSDLNAIPAANPTQTGAKPRPSGSRLPAEGPCPAGGARSFRTLSGPADETETNRSTPVSRFVQTNADSIAHRVPFCKAFL